MKCSQCQSEFSDGLIVCPHCGSPALTNQEESVEKVNETILEQQRKAIKKVQEIDAKSEKVGVSTYIVSLLFPIIGIILFFINIKEHPKKAKVSILCAVIPYVIVILFYLIVYFVYSSANL